jgi:hypothetical protein
MNEGDPKNREHWVQIITTTSEISSTDHSRNQTTDKRIVSRKSRQGSHWENSQIFKTPFFAHFAVCRLWVAKWQSLLERAKAPLPLNGYSLNFQFISNGLKIRFRLFTQLIQLQPFVIGCLPSFSASIKPASIISITILRCVLCKKFLLTWFFIMKTTLLRHRRPDRDIYRWAFSDRNGLQKGIWTQIFLRFFYA